MLKQLYAAWEPYKEMREPPTEAIKLLRVGNCTIYIEENWGPAIPYVAEDHNDGNCNHGYKQLKGDPSAISQIPEVLEWPEFEKFLQTINQADSPIESVGCEKGFFPVENQKHAKVQLGSWVGIIYSDYALNEEPKNLLKLANIIASSLKGSEEWWASIELGLERLKKLENCQFPWGLQVRIVNFGRDEDEARKYWAESLKRLNQTIANLALNFPKDNDSSTG
jgi:hypothetical protein